uniref:MADF domain-containing protein n=1 Tax=Plectus sambesii TaxID=2011161 RepID=A0A914VV50_9BILA
MATSVEFTERLIEEVKIRPWLYNARNKKSKDWNYRLQSWTDVAKLLNFDGDATALSKRWKNLRDSYSAAKKRLMQDGGKMDEPTWTYFDAMTWLDPFLQERKGKRLSRGIRKGTPNSMNSNVLVDDHDKPATSSTSEMDISSNDWLNVKMEADGNNEQTEMVLVQGETSADNVPPSSSGYSLWDSSQTAQISSAISPTEVLSFASHSGKAATAIILPNQQLATASPILHPRPRINSKYRRLASGNGRRVVSRHENEIELIRLRVRGQKLLNYKTALEIMKLEQELEINPSQLHLCE